MDDARIREQRRTRSNMRDRMSGYPERASRARDSDDSDDERRAPSRNRREQRRNNNAEDDELARAIEESKRSARADQDRARKNNQHDADMEEAMRLSREEDERQKRMLAGNSGSLFDPDNPNAGQPNGKSAWDSLIDMSDQPQQQQQPQFQQPMITGFHTTQFQSFNPYAAQQEEMARQQQMQEMQRQVCPNPDMTVCH